MDGSNLRFTFGLPRPQIHSKTSPCSQQSQKFHHNCKADALRLVSGRAFVASKNSPLQHANWVPMLVGVKTLNWENSHEHGNKGLETMMMMSLRDWPAWSDHQKRRTQVQ